MTAFNLLKYSVTVFFLTRKDCEECQNKKSKKKRLPNDYKGSNYSLIAHYYSLISAHCYWQNPSDRGYKHIPYLF